MGKMNKRWLLPLMLVLVVALTVTGCSSETPVEDAKEEVTDAGESAKEKVDDTVEEVEDDIRDVNYEDIEITPTDAFEKFMEMYPDAKITDFDLDKDLTDYKYSIEGYDTENKYEFDLDAMDARILKEEKEVYELDDEEANEITLEHIEKIDGLIEKAKMEDGSDSELDEWSISADDGRVEMKIEIGMQEYTYDMETEMLIEKD